MARQKLLALLASAIFIALFALAAMRMVAVHARTTLDERLPLLVLAGEAVAGQFNAANRDLSSIADDIARDASLANELRIFDSELSMLATTRSPSERLKKMVADQTTVVSQRLDAARAAAAKNAVMLALLDDQGRVQVSDNAALPVGARYSALVPPPPVRVEATDDDDLDEPAPAPAPPPSPVLVADAFNDVLRAAYDSKEVFVVRHTTGAIVHVAGAPIIAKDKVVGVVVLERALPTAVAIPHVETVTLIDDEVKSGKLPQGFDLKVSGPQVLPRRVSVALPVLGEAHVQPLFVDPASIGVWAQRFEIPALPGMSGVAYADMSAAFADVARIQVHIAAFAAALLVVFGVILVVTGMPIMRGLARMSDRISVAQQKGEQLRLQERDYPDALSRLVRLVNKELEKGATSKLQTGRNTKIEEVIPKKSVTLVDVDALDFGDVAPASSQASGTTVAPDVKAAPQAGAGPFQTGTGTGQFKAPTGQFKVPTGQLRVPSAQQLATPPAVGPGVASMQLDTPSGGFGQPMPSPFTSQPASATLTPQPGDARAAKMLTSLEDLSNSLMNETLANQKRLAELNQPPPRPATPPAPRPAAPADPRAAQYRETYDRFVATRKQCGEPLDDLNFNAFAQRLIETREQLMKQQGARDVKFDVYVKNGKAALRVTPVA